MSSWEVPTRAAPSTTTGPSRAWLPRQTNQSTGSTGNTEPSRVAAVGVGCAQDPANSAPKVSTYTGWTRYWMGFSRGAKRSTKVMRLVARAVTVTVLEATGPELPAALVAMTAAYTGPMSAVTVV